MGKSTSEEYKLNFNKPSGSSLSASEFMQLINALNHLYDFDTIKPLALGRGSKADFGITDNEGLYIYGQTAPLYGLAGGQYTTVIGENARGYGMRCTVFGAYAWAGNISATAIGVGAIARGTHNMALGRGAVAERPGTVIGGFGANDIWFGNGQANHPEIVSNPTTDNLDNPVGYGGQDDWSNTWIRLHGPDNADWRVNPDVALENGNGGNIALTAGKGRGSGIGGKVGFEVSRPVSGTAADQQLSSVLAGYFDSETLGNRESNFVLAMKGDAGEIIGFRRVVAGVKDSAVSGFRQLMVANDAI